MTPTTGLRQFWKETMKGLWRPQDHFKLPSDIKLGPKYFLRTSYLCSAPVAASVGLMVIILTFVFPGTVRFPADEAPFVYFTLLLLMPLAMLACLWLYTLLLPFYLRIVGAIKARDRTDIHDLRRSARDEEYKRRLELQGKEWTTTKAFLRSSTYLVGAVLFGLASLTFAVFFFFESLKGFRTYSDDVAGVLGIVLGLVWLRAVRPEKSSLHPQRGYPDGPEMGFSVSPLFHSELANDGKTAFIFPMLPDLHCLRPCSGVSIDDRPTRRRHESGWKRTDVDS